MPSTGRQERKANLGARVTFEGVSSLTFGSKWRNSSCFYETGKGRDMQYILESPEG